MLSDGELRQSRIQTQLAQVLNNRCVTWRMNGFQKSVSLIFSC